MLAAAILFFNGCEEGIESVGQEVLPEGDQINTFFNDSLSIDIRSILVDSVNSQRAVRDLFGNYIDPQFGRMVATFFTQLDPSLTTSFIEVAPEDLVFDSVVLKLAISSSYGRPESPQILQVFELQSPLPEDKLSIAQKVPINGKELSQNFRFSLESNQGQTQLSVRLDDELGRRLLFADSTSLATAANFAEFFPGISVSTQKVGFISREPGAIFELSSSGAGTQVELFYKRRDPNNQAFFNESAVFPISGGTNRYFSYTREDIENTLIKEEFFDQDSSDTYEFIQGVNLIQNFIRIPDLQALGDVLVNRGVLRLKVAPEFLGSNERFTPPQTIELFYADENGNLDTNEDGLVRRVIPAPVPYNEASRTYNIPLTDYLNEVLLGNEDNNGFIILPQFSNILVNRAVLGGSKHPTLAPELDIFYINFPQ